MLSFEASARWLELFLILPYRRSRRQRLFRESNRIGLFRSWCLLDWFSSHCTWYALLLRKISLTVLLPILNSSPDCCCIGFGFRSLAPIKLIFSKLSSLWSLLTCLPAAIFVDLLSVTEIAGKRDDWSVSGIGRIPDYTRQSVYELYLCIKNLSNKQEFLIIQKTDCQGFTVTISWCLPWQSSLWELYSWPFLPAEDKMPLQSVNTRPSGRHVMKYSFAVHWLTDICVQRRHTHTIVKSRNRWQWQVCISVALLCGWSWHGDLHVEYTYFNPGMWEVEMLPMQATDCPPIMHSSQNAWYVSIIQDALTYVRNVMVNFFT